MKPNCFSSEEEFVIWLQYDRTSTTNGNTSAFVCKDCTAVYQTAMLAQGRCDHPEVRFGMVEKKVNKEMVAEFTGYVPYGPERKLTNGYIPNATKPQTLEGTGL